MRSDLTADWFADQRDPAEYDPIRAARLGMGPTLPKRFYQRVEVGLVEGRHALLLDGKLARTKLKQPLAAPRPALAAMIAEEWAAQHEVITPATMPLTRIAHAAIDHVGAAMAGVAADILRYAGADATCYRAEEPAELVALEAHHWDPVLEHLRARYGARFVLSAGIHHVTQPEAALAAIERRLAAETEPFALAALHVLTTIAGSALIAIAVADGLLDAEAGFAAGEVDADYEVSVWGIDDEAAARRASRSADFAAATAILRALAG